MLAGSVDYGTGVDVWACACLAAEMCSGRPLFPGEDEGELVSNSAVIHVTVDYFGPTSAMKERKWSCENEGLGSFVHEFPGLQPHHSVVVNVPDACTVRRCAFVENRFKEWWVRFVSVKQYNEFRGPFPGCAPCMWKYERQRSNFDWVWCEMETLLRIFVTCIVGIRLFRFDVQQVTMPWSGQFCVYPGQLPLLLGRFEGHSFFFCPNALCCPALTHISHPWRVHWDRRYQWPHSSGPCHHA